MLHYINETTALIFTPYYDVDSVLKKCFTLVLLQQIVWRNWKGRTNTA